MKLLACLLLALLTVPQILRAETLALPDEGIEGLLILHSRTLSRQFPRLVLDMPQTVLFAGDSIMEELGPALAQMLAGKKGLKLVQAGRSSTGLCRPDFYDWPKAMREYMTTLHPKLVVICVGTNDDQSVSDAGKRYHYISPGWEQAYAHKVEEIIDIIAQNGGTSIWISPPIMGPNYLRPRVFAIKEVIRQTCERRNVVFIDVWQTLADSAGNYQRFIVDSNRKKTALRTKDGVHVTQAGNTLLARAILPQIEQGLSR